MTNVVIVGAGAAGLTAAYDLHRLGGFNITILESSSFIGGRLRKLDGFADFPIDVGGDWIQHDDPQILRRIVDQDNARLNDIKLERYLPDFKIYDEMYFYESRNSTFFEDEPYYRFIDYTWFDFFDQFIAPTSRDKINFNCIVDTVDSSAKDKPVSVNCRDGRRFQGDYVIMAVPVTVLQDPSDIAFVPPLPQNKLDALEEVKMPPGARLVLKFNERFFDDAFQLEGELDLENERFFYDLSYGQKSDDIILAVTVVGENISTQYSGKSKEEVTKLVIEDLDIIYDAIPSASFVESYYQDWSIEPFIQGSYSFYDKDSTDFQGIIRTIAQPHDRIFFAGEHLPQTSWEYGYVHGAAFSGRSAALRVYAAKTSSAMIHDPLLAYAGLVSLITSLWCLF